MNSAQTKIRSAQALLAVALLAISGTSAATAATAKFDINDSQGRDSISFNSNAPIEVINGHTNKVTGSVSIDDQLDLTKPVTAEFNVDLSSIDTGIALRNEHMRDNFLETKKFPKATFKLKSITGAASLKDGQKVQLKASGDFSLHGKTVAKTITLDVTYFKNCPKTDSKFKNCDLIQIHGSFPVKFDEHAIQRPQIVWQKLADTVVVTVDLTAHKEITNTGASAGSGTPKPASAKSPAKTAPAKTAPAK